MENVNTSLDHISISYSTIIEMIEVEKIIRVTHVLNVIQKLLHDNQSTDSWDASDDTESVSYADSVHYKMKKLANYFADSSYECEGLSDHFHNLAVAYAKQDMFTEACQIVERGIEMRETSIDLLADYIMYGRNIPGKRKQRQKYFEALWTLPRCKWNWRAYSFSVDHLLEECNYALSLDQENDIKEKAIIIAKEFVNRYNRKNIDREHLDRAFADLAGVYRVFGDSENEYRTLKHCVEKYKRVPLSSIRLAEIEFNSGNYEKVTQYLANCEEALEIQPSFSQGYIYLLLAYSNASLLFRANDPMTSEERDNLIKKIDLDLGTAEKLIESQTFHRSIRILRTIVGYQFNAVDLLPWYDT